MTAPLGSPDYDPTSKTLVVFRGKIPGKRFEGRAVIEGWYGDDHTTIEKKLRVLLKQPALLLTSVAVTPLPRDAETT